MENDGKERRVKRKLGRKNKVEKSVDRIEVWGRKNWNKKYEKKMRCCVCKDRGVKKKVLWKWSKCEVGMWVKNKCFED